MKQFVTLKDREIAGNSISNIFCTYTFLQNPEIRGDKCKKFLRILTPIWSIWGSHSTTTNNS